MKVHRLPGGVAQVEAGKTPRQLRSLETAAQLL